jgi:hypothetical protein
MKTYKKTNRTSTTIAMGILAAALAGALSLEAAAPAFADEATPDQEAQAQVAQGDAAADEGAWDATATEDGFAADAGSYAGQLGVDEGSANGVNGTDGVGASQNGIDWWRRRVSPWDALESAQAYFGVYDYSDWDYQIGRFRGIPAYRVVIDADGGWQPWNPYCWGGTTRYVAFVNYFTGRVIAGYVDYE